MAGVDDDGQGVIVVIQGCRGCAAVRWLAVVFMAVVGDEVVVGDGALGFVVAGIFSLFNDRLKDSVVPVIWKRFLNIVFHDDLYQFSSLIPEKFRSADDVGHHV